MDNYYKVKINEMHNRPPYAPKPQSLSSLLSSIHLSYQFHPMVQIEKSFPHIKTYWLI